jgi:hypothetical protein
VTGHTAGDRAKTALQGSWPTGAFKKRNRAQFRLPAPLLTMEKLLSLSEIWFSLLEVGNDNFKSQHCED